MKTSKKEKAEFLLDELSGIGTYYVEEAAHPVKKKKGAKLPTRLLGGIAAALVLSFCLGGIGKLWLGRFQEEEATEESTKGSKNSSYSLGKIGQLFFSRFGVKEEKEESLSYNMEYLHSAGESGMPDFHDKTAKVIWQTDGEIRFCALSETQYKSLCEKNSGRRLSEEESGELTLRLWLCDKNGTVTSPYLLSDGGNTAYGELFSYSPEVLPSDAFFSDLYDILT